MALSCLETTLRKTLSAILPYRHGHLSKTRVNTKTWFVSQPWRNKLDERDGCFPSVKHRNEGPCVVLGVNSLTCFRMACFHSEPRVLWVTVSTLFIYYVSHHHILRHFLHNHQLIINFIQFQVEHKTKAYTRLCRVRKTLSDILLC